MILPASIKRRGDGGPAPGVGAERLGERWADPRLSGRIQGLSNWRLFRFFWRDRGGFRAWPAPAGRAARACFFFPGFIVGVDDAGHDWVTNDVGIGKLHKSDPGGAGQDAGGFGQARAAGLTEVDLGGIAGDHAFAVLSQAGQEHEHLRGGRILGFIEDDEGMAERPAAHVGEWGDLDLTAFDHFFQFIWFDHVVEGVVQRAEVGKDFFIHVSWEETEGFARLHGWSGQDNAVDLFGFKSGDGGGHGEKCFAGAGGPDAKGDIVLLNGADVVELAFRFRINTWFARGSEESNRS